MLSKKTLLKKFASPVYFTGTSAVYDFKTLVSNEIVDEIDTELSNVDVVKPAIFWGNTNGFDFTIYHERKEINIRNFLGFVVECYCLVVDYENWYYYKILYIVGLV